MLRAFAYRMVGFLFNPRGSTTTNKMKESTTPKSESQAQGSSSGTEELEKEYPVEKILNRRTRNGKHEYYLKWKNYSDENNTWELAENIYCDDLIRDYEEQANLEKEKEKQTRKRKLSNSTIASCASSDASTSKCPKKDTTPKLENERPVTAKIPKMDKELVLSMADRVDKADKVDKTEEVDMVDQVDKTNKTEESEDLDGEEDIPRPEDMDDADIPREPEQIINVAEESEDSDGEENNPNSDDMDDADIPREPEQIINVAEESEDSDGEENNPNSDDTDDDDIPREPEKIINITINDGELLFLVKWKDIDEANFIPATDAYILWPQMVIHYYQSISVWVQE